MRSRLSVLGAALFSVFAVNSVATSGAVAAGAKSKVAAKVAAKKAAAEPATADAGKKKPAELLVDDRAISKQMQWEDKVMGSDAAKKAELAKIARASAITKAAEQAAAAAAERAPAPVAAPKPTKSTVSLPSLADEGDKNGKKDERGAKNREISAKLNAPEAAVAVPPPKPADDKFIDKILASDGNKKKTGAKSANDGELEQLLTKETDKPGSKGKVKSKRKDSVDDLLENAGKAPEAPMAIKANRSADQERMEPLPTPPPMAPVAVKKAAPVKRDDGIIHVVQGANYSVSGANRSAPVAAPAPRQEPPAPKAANWKDPFADNPSANRKVASVSPPPAPRPAASAPRVEKAPAVAAPASASAHPADWKDPFADPADGAKARAATSQPKGESKRKTVEPAAHPTGWKDPFADNSSERKTGGADARRHELTNAAPEAVVVDPPESKWKVAARHPTPKTSPAAVDGRSRWSVLKKR